LNAEQQLREQLKRVDDLRHRAQVAEDMHTYWLGHEGELAVESDVTVTRRWRVNKRVHTAYVMNREERHLFLDWTVQRARDLRAEADGIAATLPAPEVQA
jgi:hypothetical protein